MTPNELATKPVVNQLVYNSPQEYLSVDHQEINDRVTRMALDDQHNTQFVDGQKLYQNYKLSFLGKPTQAKGITRALVEKHDYSLSKHITRPDPKDILSAPIHEQAQMEIREEEATTIIAGQLGFVYQALAENDIDAAVFCLSKQTEILDSPPVAESITRSMIDILQSDLASLPNHKELLTTIASWTLDHDVNPELLRHVYIENGISLSRASHDRAINSSYALAHKITDGLIGGAKNIGYLGEPELKRFLANKLSDMRTDLIGDKISASDPLSDDPLLAGKLLHNIIATPEIFDKLHPQVQHKLHSMMEGFLFDSQVDRSALETKATTTDTPETLIVKENHRLSSTEASPTTLPKTTTITETKTTPIFDENTIRSVSTIKSLAELHEVLNLQHEFIKSSASIELSRLILAEFSNLWKTLKREKTKGINLLFTRILQKDRIPVIEADRIDELRRELEGGEEFKNGNEHAISKVIAINIAKEQILAFNG